MLRLQRLLLAVTAIPLWSTSSAQYNLDWANIYAPNNRVNYYTGGGHDAGGNVWVSGKAFLAGGFGGGVSSYQFSLAKYSSAGGLLWNREYNASQNVSSGDYPAGMALDSQSNACMVGSSSDAIEILKYSANGTQQWVKTLPEITPSARAIAIGPSDSIYVLGTVGGASSVDVLIAKYDSAGELQWAHPYNGPANGADTAVGMKLDSAGNCYIAANTWSGTSQDYLVLKYSAAGALQWFRPCDGVQHTIDNASDCAMDGAENFLIAGCSDNQFLTLKYDADGNQIAFSPGLQAPYSEAKAFIAVDNALNYFVAVEAFSGIPFVATTKYSPGGSLVWTKTFTSYAQYVDAPVSIACDGTNAYVAVNSNGLDTGQDPVVLKYDGGGNLSWETRFYYSGGSADVASAVFYANGRVFLLGNISGNQLFVNAYSQDEAGIVYPSTLSITRGSVTSGTIASIFRPDDSYMLIRPGLVFASADPPIQVVVEGTTANLSPSALDFYIETGSLAVGIQQKTYLYDFAAGQWAQLDARTLPRDDTRIRIHITTNPGRFIEPGTGVLRAKVTARSTTVLFSYPWRLRVNQAVWKTAS